MVQLASMLFQVSCYELAWHIQYKLMYENTDSSGQFTMLVSWKELLL